MNCYRHFDTTDFMIYIGVLAMLSFVLPIMVCLFLQPFFNNILSRIINIEYKVGNLESKIDNLKSKINDFYDVTFSDFHYAVSLLTQCSINFIKYNNLNGSSFGVYSIIGDKEYIISNRHVVYDSIHNITRIISQIAAFDGTNLLIYSKEIEN